MDDRIRRLLEEKAGLVTRARELIDRVEGESRDFGAEEQNEYDTLHAQIAATEVRAQRLQTQTEVEARLNQAAPTLAGGRDSIEGPSDNRGGADPQTQSPIIEAEGRAYARRLAERQSDGRAAFRSFLRHGLGSLTEPERRALQMDSDTAGGFLVPPQEFVASLIVFVNDQVWMRQLATVMPTITSDSLGVPVLDADPADADWTAELAVGNEDTTMKFGKRELRPHPLAKFIKISSKLVRSSALDVEGVVIERLGYKFGVAAEKGYLTGTGTNQPLGVFTASNDGIDTTRDVSTGNSTTAIAADNLIEVKYKLKANYWSRAHWIFHRAALKQIMKLKDSNGQYLWRLGGFNTGLTMGQPDTLLEQPVHLSEYAPSTFTTGLYVGILGDFSRYWIVDALNMQFQRLIELYAATNQIGYIGRLESDGMPVLAEAFARVTLA